MTRDALIRDLLAVPYAEEPDPTCLGYEGRFVALCLHWPDVALPRALGRGLTRDDLRYDAPTELYDWILGAWQADKPLYFSAFIYEREGRREEVDSWWRFRELWLHFGDVWFPDQWHPQASEGWPEVTAEVAESLIDRILDAGLRRRVQFASRRIEWKVQTAANPRKALATVLQEYRKAARRARPKVKALHTPDPRLQMTVAERRKDAEQRLGLLR